MGKDIDGRELGKGITQRKDGRYSFKGTFEGQRHEYTFSTLSEALFKKREFNNLKNKKIESVAEDIRYIYFISDGENCKIGYATDVESRMRDLQIAASNELKLLHSFRTSDYRNIENQLHIIFKKYHVSGEWYDILDLFDGGKKKKK